MQQQQSDQVPAGASASSGSTPPGEYVVDVPAKLAARVRMLDTGHGRKTDAHSVAVAAVRAKELRVGARPARQRSTSAEPADARVPARPRNRNTLLERGGKFPARSVSLPAPRSACAYTFPARRGGQKGHDTRRQRTLLATTRKRRRLTLTATQLGVSLFEAIATLTGPR